MLVNKTFQLSAKASASHLQRPLKADQQLAYTVMIKLHVYIYTRLDITTSNNVTTSALVLTPPLSLTNVSTSSISLNRGEERTYHNLFKFCARVRRNIIQVTSWRGTLRQDVRPWKMETYSFTFSALVADHEWGCNHIETIESTVFVQARSHCTRYNCKYVVWIPLILAMICRMPARKCPFMHRITIKAIFCTSVVSALCTLIN